MGEILGSYHGLLEERDRLVPAMQGITGARWLEAVQALDLCCCRIDLYASLFREAGQLIAKTGGEEG